VNQSEIRASEESPEAASSAEARSFVTGLWGVRYQVKDVARSLAFYTQHLGFKVDQPACLRAGSNRQSQTDPQRPWCVRFSSNA
jgi:hypothetical protein